MIPRCIGSILRLWAIGVMSGTTTIIAENMSSMQPTMRRKTFNTMKTNEKKNADEPRTQELAPIFAAAVNRTDQWRELHALSRAWATARGTQAESQRGEAARLLHSISRLEQCWAYPGSRLLAALGEAMAQRDAATFARLV